ncbi:hypothetical protein FOA52_011286 [Chlamydomonas sp. UWO 241]|nr:hypothetical protein FOA52_011286 [Chlamydomonas sp. UWO 241]
MASAQLAVVMGRVQNAANMKADRQDESLLAQAETGCNLSMKQRLIGFGACVGLGVVLSLVAIPLLFLGNIPLFAVFYSLGSLLSIGSTMFLMGPLAQIKRMFEDHRMLATIVFLSAIVGTLLVAFLMENAALCLVLLFVQMCALSWYCITWIPGAQIAIKGFFS